jgi:hypothetical protein
VLLAGQAEWLPASPLSQDRNPELVGLVGLNDGPGAVGNRTNRAQPIGVVDLHGCGALVYGERQSTSTPHVFATAVVEQHRQATADVVHVIGGRGADGLAYALAVAVIAVGASRTGHAGAGQPIGLVTTKGVAAPRRLIPGVVDGVVRGAGGRDAIGMVVGVAGGLSAEHLAQTVAVAVVAVCSRAAWRGHSRQAIQLVVAVCCARLSRCAAGRRRHAEVATSTEHGHGATQPLHLLGRQAATVRRCTSLRLWSPVHQDRRHPSSKQANDHNGEAIQAADMAWGAPVLYFWQHSSYARVGQ